MAPGESYTYTWKVTEAFAPTKSDPTCLTWIYHSHVDAPKDIATELIGVLLTCNKGHFMNFVDTLARLYCIVTHKHLHALTFFFLFVFFALRSSRQLVWNPPLGCG